MKRGDLVAWKYLFGQDLPVEIGILLEVVPFESRMNDPFPHWRVLFGDRGVLQCRECHLQVISETR